MAEQYPAGPHYAASYQNAMPYSSLPPNESQTSPTSSMYQQSTMSIHNQQIPVAQANDLRFNANMQIPPSNAPFSFPPSLNPDLLKHFPPPPPPPTGFLSNPGTPVNFPYLAGQSVGMLPAYNQQGYSSAHGVLPQDSGGSVQQTSTGFPSYPTDTQGAQYGSDQPSHSKALEPNSSYLRQSKHDAEPYTSLNAQEHLPGEDFLAQGVGDNNQGTDMYDPANAFRIHTDAVLNSATLQNNPPQQQSASNRNMHTSNNDISHAVTSSVEDVSQEELKEKAKAAILALSSHRISYTDLVAEGLDSNVLQNLFAELGLDMHIKTHITQKAAATTRQADQLVTYSEDPSQLEHHIDSNVEAIDQTRSSLPGQPAAITSGMERKDRIAQLLAAKAAKAGAVGIASPSASPASISGSTSSRQVAKDELHRPTNNGMLGGSVGGQPTKPVTSSENMKQRLAQLQNMAGELLRSASNDAVSSGVPPVLPTPVRETLVKSGLSSMIPGLFEDGDEEQAKELPDLQNPSIDADRGLRSKPPPFTAGNASKKRSSDSSTDLRQRAAKRPATLREYSREMRMEDLGSESGEASEGEIIENAPAQNHSATQYPEPRQSPTEPKRSPLLSDPNRNQLEVPTHKSGTKAALPEAIRGNLAMSSPRPISKLTPAQLTERAAQLKADLLKQRRIRQQQLTEGMPALNEEVVKTQQRIDQSKIKLAEIRAQLQKYEADAARARQSERDILEEIQRLETQLEDGMSGQKRFSDELRNIKSQATEFVPLAEITPSGEVDALSTQTARPVVADVTPTSLVHERMDSSVIMEKTAFLPGTATNEMLDHPTPVIESVQELAGNSPGMTLQVINQPEPEDVGEKRDSGDADHTVNVKNFTNEPGTFSSTDHTSNNSDQAVSELDWDTKSQDSRMSIDEESEDGSAGSASMSDSGSEDYDPAEHGPTTLAEDHEDDSEEYEPEDDGPLPLEPEDNADDYEPSELIEIGDHNGSPEDKQVPSPITGASPRECETNGQRDRATSHSIPLVPKTLSQPSVHDQEDSNQLLDTNILSRPEPMVHGERVELTELDLDASLPAGPHYVPYQSPLSSFKSYRFHSSFNDQVKSGYRSLTYSNKIDPKTPICPTELAGETCQDTECQEQHFGSMALTDDKILVQMSSANDIADIPLRDEYLLGLKQVIASLRERDVKDFSVVADALSRYRRDWTATHLDV